MSHALDRMYREAAEQMTAREWPRLRSSASAQERADALSDFYLPITPAAGRLLDSLVRATRPATVVEFSMSLGISALRTTPSRTWTTSAIPTNGYVSVNFAARDADSVEISCRATT